MSTTYNILPNMLLSKAPYAKKKNTGDHRFGLVCSRAVTGHMFCIRQIFEKNANGNCSEAVHRLFVDFKKAYDSVRREVLYNILIEFGIPVKQVRLIKMCLTEIISEAG